MGSALAQGYQNGMKQGVVRIKVKPQITATLANVKTKSTGGVLSTGIQPLDRVNAKLTAVEMKRVFPYSPRYEEKHRKYGLDLWYEVKYTSEVSPREAVAQYLGVDGVSFAEPVLQKKLITGEVKNVPVPTSNGTEPFDDPYLSKQWHYHNTGELTESVAGGDINLYEGWKIETGKPNVVVCVVDGGVDIDHEDLAANIWVNESEKNGEEGVDDDGNGYVDDINGYNFVSNSARITDHFHGTHVAGTVAAVNNNGVGVAGVAGGSGNNDGVRLMSAQIFSEEAGNSSNTAAGIVYGADNGAVIS
jgi:Subtilase family.